MLTDIAVDGLAAMSEPGEVVMLAGRPGTGVSTMLARVAGWWTTNGGRAVMASWERPADALLRDFPTLTDVEVLDILGWTVDELARGLDVPSPDQGTLVAIDYLQLINGPEDVGARVASLARRLGVRILLGAMAPRAVAQVEGGAPSSSVLRVFADNIGSMSAGDPRHVHRLAALVGGGSSSDIRRLIISKRSPNLHEVDSAL